jgi:uncharacterized protein YndB with AHSA1/START domain
MAREFELRKEIELEATPDQVWEAITTGAGNAAWLWAAEDTTPDGPGVTAWDPPTRLVVQVPEAEDGSTDAFEYLIEARDGGSTVLRFVHSGILGDNWDSEYEGITSSGWDMYLHTLAQYLKHFPGRPATYIAAEGPQASAEEAAWPVLVTGLGLADPVDVGDQVRLTPQGLAPIEGVIDYVLPAFLGVRSDDALYRFHGRAALGMPIAVGHHFYGESVDAEKVQNAWETWLNRTFS